MKPQPTKAEAALIRLLANVPARDRPRVLLDVLEAGRLCTPTAARQAFARDEFLAQRDGRFDFDLAKEIATRWGLSNAAFWSGVERRELSRLSNKLKSLVRFFFSTDLNSGM